MVAAQSALAHPGLQGFQRFWQHKQCQVAVVVQPSHVSLAPGGRTQATLAVSVRDNGGSPVRLAVAGAPSGVTALVAPGALSRSGAAVVTLTANPTARPGRSTITVTAACNDRSASAKLDLTVTAPPSTTALSVSPAQGNVDPGGTIRFCVRVPAAPSTGPSASHGRHQEKVREHEEAPQIVVTGLPPGARATLARATPTHVTSSDSCRYLTVTVPKTLAAGDYTFTVRAVSERGAVASVTVALHVGATVGQPFTVTGDLKDQLSPGLDLPLDLTFTNPNPTPITLTALTVAIDQVDAAHAAGCSVAPNYRVRQFTGDLTKVVIPAGGEVKLSALGLPAGQWPQIGMLDTDFEQNGCLGSTLKLAYSASADGP